MTMGRSDYDQTNAGTYGYANQLVAGADVYGMDDEKIGTIADVGTDYFLVQKGWLFIQDLYLPMSTIARMDAERVYLRLTKQEAEQMGREALPETGDAWYGAPGADYTATGATTNTAYGAGYGTDREVGRTVREGENINVPIVEEELKAGVREREAGRARIVKDVTQEQQTLDVPVEREEVYVTERAVNRPATEADLAMRDREIEIPLREQEVVTQKEARVTGEVNVRKEVRRDTERVSDTVRREDVRVENPNTPGVHTEGTRGMAGRTTETDYGTASTAPTDTAYDRSGIAGDRYTTTDTDMTGTPGRDDEGIIDRAKDKLRGRDDRMTD